MGEEKRFVFGDNTYAKAQRAWALMLTPGKIRDMKAARAPRMCRRLRYLLGDKG